MAPNPFNHDPKLSLNPCYVAICCQSNMFTKLTPTTRTTRSCSTSRATRPREDNFLSMILGKIVGSPKKEQSSDKEQTESPRRNNFTLTGMIMEGKRQRSKSE